MAESASTLPPSGIGSLRVSDFLKGLWLSVGSAVLSLVYLLISNHWKMPTFDQIEPYINAISIGFLSYIGKNLTTNNVGQLFKRDQPVLKVDAAQAAAANIPPKPYSAPNDSTAN